MLLDPPALLRDSIVVSTAGRSIQSWAVPSLLGGAVKAFEKY